MGNKQEILHKIAEELFFMAKGLGQAMTDIAFTSYGKLRIRKMPERTYYYNLKKFEKNGLIKKVRKQYGPVYVLTDKARHLRKRPSQKPNRTDELSTIVMFDIPEEKRKTRDSLRRYLLKNGYTQIQKSVFISPFKIFGELTEFIRELDIERHVTFISGKIDR